MSALHNGLSKNRKKKAEHAKGHLYSFFLFFVQAASFYSFQFQIKIEVLCIL